MKKVGTVLSYLIYFLLYLSTVLPKGAVSEPLDSIESNLNNQTVVFDENFSTSTEINEDIPVSEGSGVTNIETHSDSIVDASKSNSHFEDISKPGFSEVFPQNSGIDKIINNDTPVAVSRIDSATGELQERAPPLSNDDPLPQETAIKQTNDTKILSQLEEDRSDFNVSVLETDSDKSAKENLTTANTEDIPSFSEWAQKHLEEVEKKEQTNFSAPNQTINATKPGSGAKLRWKNYASVDCGAKVILANPEGKNTWAILSPSRDEYKLDPCNSRIWFIVELCEAIQLKKVDMANYELFSSSPKEFAVSVSDRFPTRDWSVVGQFVAKDERDVQSFDINTDTFGKYVKVEIKSHYGAEHYCPLSLFRAYGTSVFEVLQKDDPAHEQPVEEEDDDEALDHTIKGDSSGNLLSSATDAVLSMVKKAAQVLGNKVVNESSQVNNGTELEMPIIKSCRSPSHYVVCNNCSDLLFGKIFQLLSCKQRLIKSLVSVPFVEKALLNSLICCKFGIDFRNKSAQFTVKSCPQCVASFFPLHYIGAMCNELAISYNKVIYNISYQYANTTDNISQDNFLEIKQDSNQPPIVNSNETVEETVAGHKPTEPLNIEQSDINSKSSCSTDTTYASQIKPTKSLSTELPMHSEVNTVSVNMGEYADTLNYSEQQNESQGLTIDSTFVETASDASSPEMEMVSENSGEDSIDKMMTEVGNEPSLVVSTSTAATNLQGQKESVFLRLSNRIKALERNMSLSGQYLEELSKRYKKQVEEMQRVLEKTEHTLEKVTKSEEERHKQLEDKIESLTTAVETLLAERNSWKATSYWLFFAVAFIFLVYCFNRYSTFKSKPPPAPKHVEVQRRNSVDVLTQSTPKKKKRRPSDQALKIVASAASGDQEKQHRKRKKRASTQSDDMSAKFSPKCTSSKIWLSKSSSADWVESRKVIEDIPFVLEESDNSTLEPLPMTLELDAIEVPPFLNTAASARLGRSTFRNQKSKSDEARIRQPSPVLSVSDGVSSGNDQTPKKEKKGFKKLLKKVF